MALEIKTAHDDIVRELKGKYSAHSLRRLFYNSLHGIDDVDKEALDGHIKGVRARYHGSVDEMKKVIELMRERYEYAMRDLLPATSEDQRKKAIIDFMRMQGWPEEKINKARGELEKALQRVASADELRDRYRELMEAERQKQGATEGEARKASRTARNGGTRLDAPYETRIVVEDEFILLLNQGWDIIKELNGGRVIVRRLNE